VVRHGHSSERYIGVAFRTVAEIWRLTSLLLFVYVR